MRNQASDSNQPTGEDGLLGRKARELYKDGDPKSVACTITSLFFKSMREGGYNAEDFR
jgi:hypothetical protein